MLSKISKAMISAIVAAFSFGNAVADIPNGYYDDCENKLGGKTLLKALYQTIGDHDVVSYKGLWSVYLTSDVDENGKIWDMYSTKRWTPSKEQCGQYSKVGDCYNREHSFPKSWFDDKSPMISDAFHIYPTDGKVNGQRSNHPYGECSGGTSVEANGSIKPLGKLGKSTFPGYSGTVFEPVDEYKGDFARTYFYMAACYNDRISTWQSDMLARNDYPCYSSWAVELLMKWHRQDPVSKKERDRNDAVYAYQGNRNPFIDHPELAEYIWGDKTSERWSSSLAPDPIDPDPIDPDPDDPDPDDPDPDEPDPDDGEGSVTNPYNCSQIIRMDNAIPSAWVYGYVVGSINGMDIETTTNVTTNFAIADKSKENDVTNVLGVQLPGNSAFVAELNLKDNPANVGKMILINGRITDYFGRPGIKDVKEYRWIKPDDIGGDDESAISDVEQESVSISVNNGCVNVTSGSQSTLLSIVSADGMVWYSGQVHETQQFSLPAGIYIFRTPGNIQRILVK